MKKVFLNVSILLLALIVMPTLTTAMELSSVHVLNTTENKKLVVNLSKMYGKQVVCSIIDDADKVVYREIVINTGQQMAKKYDLKKLPVGNYTLVLDDELSVEKLTFTLTRDRILYHSTKSQVVYKPIIKVMDDKTVLFNLLSLGKNVKISVMDDSDILYRESYANHSSISKKINFASMKSGEYTVKVDVGGETFYNTVKI